MKAPLKHVARPLVAHESIPLRVSRWENTIRQNLKNKPPNIAESFYALRTWKCSRLFIFENWRHLLLILKNQLLKPFRENSRLVGTELGRGRVARTSLCGPAHTDSRSEVNGTRRQRSRLNVFGFASVLRGGGGHVAAIFVRINGRTQTAQSRQEVFRKNPVGFQNKTTCTDRGCCFPQTFNKYQ